MRLTAKQLALRRSQHQEYFNQQHERYMTCYAEVLNDMTEIDEMFRQGQDPKAIRDKIAESLVCDSARWEMWNSEQRLMFKRQRQERQQLRKIKARR